MGNLVKQQEIQFYNIDKGFICPCCKTFVKRYSRHFNSNMALAILMLYKKRDEGFLHIENLMIENGYKRCGDASYLRHYNLIEPYVAKRNDGSSRNGYYRITSAGILFAENKLTVKERFLTFNNNCQGFEGSDISIIDALGKKFKYDQLMS